MSVCLEKEQYIDNNLLWFVFFERAIYIVIALLWYEFISIYWDLQRNTGQLCKYIRRSRSEGWCIYPSNALNDWIFLFKSYFHQQFGWLYGFSWDVLRNTREMREIVLKSENSDRELKSQELLLPALYNRG